MIIVEGPDGAGKTTLIARIEKYLGIEREPRAVSKEAKSLRPLDTYVAEELDKGFGLRLYDRFALISSAHYACLPGRTVHGQMKDPAWLRQQHKRLAAINPMVIYCLPPLEVVLANVQGDETNRVVWDQIEGIYWSYHFYVARNIGGAQFIWDYTHPDEFALKSNLQWARARVQKGK